MTIIVTMTKLSLTIAAGFWLNKRGILDAETCKKLSSMIVNFTSPLLIISSAVQISGGRQSDILLMLVSGLILYCTFPPVSALVIRLMGVPSGCRGIYRSMLIHANVAFMGYPVVQALYGETSIFLYYNF